jgi:hypothetical protein
MPALLIQLKHVTSSYYQVVRRRHRRLPHPSSPAQRMRYDFCCGAARVARVRCHPSRPPAATLPVVPSGLSRDLIIGLPAT